jgi:hypothetical protein
LEVLGDPFWRSLWSKIERSGMIFEDVGIFV